MIKYLGQLFYLYTGISAKGLLLSFSIYTNASKILNTKQPPGSLTAVNGIRFISMTWVILGHNFAFALPPAGTFVIYFHKHFSRNVRKRTFWHVRLTKTQLSLPLRKHTYSNIQKISPPETENFQIKNSNTFSYFCSKHRLWILVRTASTRRF